MPEFHQITLLNPHADDFIKTPVSFWLVRRRGLGKYAYLIDEPAKHGERVNVLIDGTLSSLGGQGWFARLPRWLRVAVLKLEVKIWFTINQLDDKITVHWSADTIADRNALYIFSYKNCVGNFSERKRSIDLFSQKLVNLSHYFIRTKEKARNIATLENTILVAESDLHANDYFRHHFGLTSRMCVVPFAVNERFMMIRNFHDRGDICAATGSFHNLVDEKPRQYYEDFLSFFTLDCYHPVRKLLYERRTEIKDWLDCRISPYREESSSSGLIARLLAFFQIDVAQSRYFSFDIVKFYNDHQFAIVGEEASGHPTIGFFEAMACGCVMLGQQGAYYDGLGLEPDRHYLAHDGSLAGIRSAIETARARPDFIAVLSQAGQQYIGQHCSPSSVWDRLRRHVPAA